MARPDQSRFGTPRPPSGQLHHASQRLAPWTSAAAVVAALVLGAAQRAWLLSHTPLTGDEAIVGLMARQIHAGHFSTFYWGQHYGGVEPYAAAAVTGVLGSNPTSLNMTSVLLSAVAAVLVAMIVTSLTGRRALGVLAASVSWVWPYALVWNSTHELGFRFATLVLGLTAIYLAISIYQGAGSTARYLLLGLCLGAGWWASPEITYFATAALLILTFSLVRTSRRNRYKHPVHGSSLKVSSSITTVALAALVGAGPWIYTNTRDGFVSLRSAGLPASTTTTYPARICVFFGHVLPSQLGLRALLTGKWTGGPDVGHCLYILALLLLAAAIAKTAYTVAVGRFDPAEVSLALAVLVFPFLEAASPASGYWVDGRYGMYLGPMLVVLVFSCLGPSRAQSRDQLTSRRANRLAGYATYGAIAFVVIACALTQLGARATSGTPAVNPSAFFSNWHNADRPVSQSLRQMQADRITDAYGDYWTAYVLDYLAPKGTTISPSPLDIDRTPEISQIVKRSKNPAWLFFPPGRTTEDVNSFSNPQPGPGPFSEKSFTTLLDSEGVRYKVYNLGILDAVVPQKAFVIK